MAGRLRRGAGDPRLRADGALKNASASSFYKVMNLISSLKMPSNAGDFRLMDREVVAAVRELSERTRFG